MIKVLMQPKDAYSEFLDLLTSSSDAGHSDSEIIIGRCDEFGTELTLGITRTGHPIFYVYMDDNYWIDKEITEPINPKLLEDTTEKLINDFLEGDFFVADNMGDEITEREEELDRITDDFLTSALFNSRNDKASDMTCKEYNALVADCKNAFLTYLYKKHHISVYRPSEDKSTGQVVLYPYGE